MRPGPRPGLLLHLAEDGHGNAAIIDQIKAVTLFFFFFQNELWSLGQRKQQFNSSLASGTEVLLFSTPPKGREEVLQGPSSFVSLKSFLKNILSKILLQLNDPNRTSRTFYCPKVAQQEGEDGGGTCHNRLRSGSCGCRGLEPGPAL